MGLFLLFVSAISCTPQTESAGERPIVQVNSSVLTAKEFGEELAARLRSYDALYAKQESNVQRVKEDILNEFITSVILTDHAKRKGLPAPEQEVEEQVRRLLSSYPDDIYVRN